MPETTRWEAVHERAYHRLRCTAARLVSWQDADDLVQDSYVHALQAECGFRSEAAVTTWLHRIVVNASFDCLRQRKRRGIHVGLEHCSATSRGWDPTDAYAIRTAWRSLTRQQRTVAYLHDVAGFTHDEIARRLRICAGNSKKTLFGARRKLRRRLRLQCGVDASLGQ